MSADETELRKKAEKIAEEKIGFIIHFGVFIAVNLFLIGIWRGTTGIGSFPWFVFPLGGWGIGLVSHFLVVYSGRSYKKKLVERELEKLKKE